MGDYIDDANKAADTHLGAALGGRKPEGPKPNGRCHNCDEPLSDPTARWCDAMCRDDWEYINKFA